MSRKWIVAFAVFALLLLWPASLAFAQPPQPEPPKVEWRELKTNHFVIVYAGSVEGLDIFTCRCGLKEARFYEDFIDDVYSDLVGVFNVELETPINLRLFPTEESYFEVNPLAEQLTGVIAHALNDRSEIAIALTRTHALSDEEIANNMRHELSHFFASLLSDGNLTAGFQEGTAQYLEKPTDTAAYDPTILQAALDQNRLLTWEELDRAGQIWRDPQVAYPEALSITAFLVDRYGFPKYLDLLSAHAAEPGYRSALETTYGKSADELETEWRAYLPQYFDGRWQINALYAYDLSRPHQLVEAGAYTDATAELAEIVDLLQTTNQADTLAEAEQLLARAAKGQAAGALADDARRQLEQNNYAAAVQKANQSIAAFEELDNRDRIPELQIYIQRAELGQEALAELQQGEAALNSLQFFEAEQQIREATILLQSLNNQAAAQHGVGLLAQLSNRQKWLAFAMLLTGALLLFINAVRRVVVRLTANPLEVEYT